MEQPQAKRDFQSLQKSHELFGRFDDPLKVIHFLNDGMAGDPEEKNILLGSLIRCAHEYSDLSATIMVVLFVALFPALDRVFRTLLPFVSNTRYPEAKLANDIFWTFHKEIDSWDFNSRHRVAATLQMNVRRIVKKQCIEDSTPPPQPKEPFDACDYSMDQIWDQIVSEEQKPDVDIVKEGILDHSPVKDIDLHLIVGRFVHGHTFEELAQQLGITKENARQRFRRAKKLIRSRKKSGF